MIDCINSEIRDMLPDKLHGTLSRENQRRVDEHVAQCAACSEELELLSSVRAISAAPHVDVARIAGTIAPYRRPRVLSVPLMRIAAGIAIIAVGGASYSLASRSLWLDGGSVAESTLALLGSDSARQLTVAVPDTHVVRGDIASLDDQAMADLLAQIENLGAEIRAEPKPLVKSPGTVGGIE